MTDDIARTIIADLLRVGTQSMTHRYRGQCPDVPCKGPEHATSRDPLCAACRALTRADVWMAGETETSPLSLSAQVRARLGKGDLSLLMNTSRPASRIFSATWHREYPDGVVSDRRDADGPDVDACLRAVLAWEDDADRQEPEHAPPIVPGPTEESLSALRARVERLGQRVAAVTSIRPHGERGVWDREYDNARAELARRDAEPGPTERIDMALRFRYRGGVFVVPEGRMRGRHTTMGPHHYSVLGLRVRIVYEHNAADTEAAQDCAESWRSRMRGAGAREVECVGEVVT